MSCHCDETQQTPIPVPFASVPIAVVQADIDTNSPDSIAMMRVQGQTNFRFSIRVIDESGIGNTVVKVVARLSHDDPNWTEIDIEDRITGEGMSPYPIDISGISEIGVQVETLSGEASSTARVTLYAE